MSEELADLHQLEPARFFEQVHCFEFWFEAVEGYLDGLDHGHRRETPEAVLPEAERERLITVLCNYCVGETTALEGAGGLDPDRSESRDEDLPLDADGGRGPSSRGARAPPARAGRRRSRARDRAAREPALLEFKRRLLGARARAGLGWRPVRAERDPRGDGVHGLPGARAQRRSAHPRGIARHREGRTPPHRASARTSSDAGSRPSRAPRCGSPRSAASSIRWSSAASATRWRARGAGAKRAPTSPSTTARRSTGWASHERRGSRCTRRRRSLTSARVGASSSTTAASTRCRRVPPLLPALGRVARHARAQRGPLPGLQDRGALDPRAPPRRPPLLHGLHVAPRRGLGSGRAARSAGRLLTQRVVATAWLGRLLRVARTTFDSIHSRHPLQFRVPFGTPRVRSCAALAAGLVLLGAGRWIR